MTKATLTGKIKGKKNKIKPQCSQKVLQPWGVSSHSWRHMLSGSQSSRVLEEAELLIGAKLFQHSTHAAGQVFAHQRHLATTACTSPPTKQKCTASVVICLRPNLPICFTTASVTQNWTRILYQQRAQLCQHCISPPAIPKVESTLLNAVEETATTKAQIANLKITFQYLRSKCKQIQSAKAWRLKLC